MKINEKKEAMGAIGYMLLFGMAIIMVITTMYLVQMAKLITHQHDIDDALADSVLASLVADEEYYFATGELYGTPVVLFKDRDDSFDIYRECMVAAVSNTEDFYNNFKFDTFILYEVNGSSIRVTTYSSTGSRTTSNGRLGYVKTPDGTVVTKTSAYGRVKFDIKSILDGSYITKTRDIYCAIEVN